VQVFIGSTSLELIEGNIAEQAVDAVVNAAQSDLRGGQGVDGAIHGRGGPQLLDECRRIGGCPVGRAVITSGGRLPARFVIHAVGPVFDPHEDVSALLASAYHNSLRIAAAYGLSSIAFPAISAGAFCFPMALAAEVGVRAVVEFLRTEEHVIDTVRFVLYTRENRHAYELFASALSNASRLRAG
jgi:O-acetyl-ADP-ribose deacetylase